MLWGGCKRAVCRQGTADPAAVIQDSAIPTVTVPQQKPSLLGDAGHTRLSPPQLCGQSSWEWLTVSKTNGSPWKGPLCYPLTSIFCLPSASLLSISTSYPEPIQVLKQPSPQKQQKINPEKKNPNFISLFLLRQWAELAHARDYTRAPVCGHSGSRTGKHSWWATLEPGKRGQQVAPHTHILWHQWAVSSAQADVERQPWNMRTHTEADAGILS